MPNKSEPNSILNSNGQPRRGFSLLSAQWHKRSWLRTTAQLLVVSMVAFGGVGIIRAPHTNLPAAIAQDPGDDWTGTDIAPSGNLTLDDPTIGQAPDFGPSPQNSVPAPFNTSDPNYYTDKAASDLANPSPAPAPTSPNRPTPQPGTGISAPGFGPSVEFSQAGTDQNDAGTFPPDTHGAVGRSHHVEVVNDQVLVYPRITSPGSSFPDKLGPCVKQCSLEQLFSYSGFYDPRVIYDRVTDRFIITAPAFPESTSKQYLYVGVSAPGPYGPNAFPFAQGTYIIQPVNVHTNDGNFFDYPSVGIDQNAIIITGNVYHGYNLATGGNSGGGAATLFTIPKSILYSVPLNPPPTPYNPPYYSGLNSTLQPPIKLDNTPYTYCVAAPYAGFHYPGNKSLTLYRLSNTNLAAPRLQRLYVDVPAYYSPRSAKQPGTPKLLDTLDGRFQSESTQIGDSLFNVHCANSLSAEQGGYTRPSCLFYEINTGLYAANSRPSLRQRLMFNSAATSDDFTPSLCADDNKNVYLSWNATNVRNSQNAQVWCGGRVATDPANTLRSFVLEFQSSVNLQSNYDRNYSSNPNLMRWGDYSFVTIDPLAPGRAWGVQENILPPHTSVLGNASYVPEWGSQIWRFNLGQ